MEAKFTELYPVYKNFNDLIPDPIIDDVGGGVVYYGYAPIGSKSTDAKWRIKRVTRSGSTLITPEYPDASMEFKFKWSDRTSLTYSR